MKSLVRVLPSDFCVIADKDGRRRMANHVASAEGAPSPYVIGRSILTEPIEMYKIGEGGRRVAIFAAHHALESLTCNILYAIIYILSRKEWDTELTVGLDRQLLLSCATFYFIPCVNPDGIELRFHGVGDNLLRQRQLTLSGGDFSSWQANARGVDLNHNYDYGFREYKEIEKERYITAGNSLFSGEYPESEPETRAVASFIRALSPDLVVSLHSQGEEIYCSPECGRSIAVANYISRETGYAVSVPMGTASFGGLCDYTGALGITSVTLEVGRGRNPLSEELVYSILGKIGKCLISLPTII